MEEILSQPIGETPSSEPEWISLLQRLECDYPTEQAQLEALARLEAGENAFPEDLLARGRQIFGAVCDVTAGRLCRHPTVLRMVNANGPRTSEALTIIPLLLNLLEEQPLREASVALSALLIVRMGVGTFCSRYGAPPKVP
jgi:hypothetical protein